MNVEDKDQADSAISHLRQLAFNYVMADRQVKELSEKLIEAKANLNQSGRKLSDYHIANRTRLGRLNDRLTVQSHDHVYHFKIENGNVSEFVSDTAI